MSVLSINSLASSRWGLFAGSSDGNKTFLSNDKGQSWFETRYSPTELAPGFINMTFSENVGAGTNYISSMRILDSGRQWRQIRPVPLQFSLTGTEEFVALKNAIFCSTSNAERFLIASYDSGNTWSAAPSQALLSRGAQWTYHIVTGAKDIVYTFANTGTFLSRDTGRTWEQRSSNIFQKPDLVRYFAAAINDSTLLASSTVKNYVSSENVISYDSGKTWQSLRLPLPEKNLYLRQALKINHRWFILVGRPPLASRPNSIIFSSTDQGQTWLTESDNLPNSTILSIGFDENSVFASVLGYGLYRTDLTTVNTREETQNTLFISSPAPNPSTDYTDLAFTLPRAAQAGVTLYSTFGTEVWRSESATMSAGEQHIRIDTRHLPTGVYAYRLVVDGVSSLGRIVVVR